MSEYEAVRNALEEESTAIKKRLEERPQMFSEYGKAYWKGNVEALDWALKKIADIHLSTQRTNKNE